MSKVTIKITEPIDCRVMIVTGEGLEGLFMRQKAGKQGTPLFTPRWFVDRSGAWTPIEDASVINALNDMFQTTMREMPL